MTIKSKDHPGEVRKRAAADSEILGDPSMHLTLEHVQNEPQPLRDHLWNPAVGQKIQKWIDSGIIGIRQS